MATNSIVASGQFINIDTLVQNSVKSQQNKLSAILNKQNTVDVKISSLGQIKSQLDGLFDKFKNIQNASSSFTINGNDAGLDIKASKSGNYQIEVKQLATAQITTSGKIESGSLGFSGILKVETGTYNDASFNQVATSLNIEVLATDTLEDIQNKINKTGLVNTSIINAQDGKHLSLSSIGVGANAGFKIEVEDANNTGLGIFSFTQGQSTYYNEVSKAKSAIANINGVNITTGNNQFTNMDGLSFSANKVTTLQNINIQKDNTNLESSINEFVTEFNLITKNLKSTNLDNKLNNFGSNVRNLMYTTSSESLSKIGLSFDKTGVLGFDEIKFQSYAKNEDKLTSVINFHFAADSKVSELFKKELDVNGQLDSLTNSLMQQSVTLKNSVQNVQDVLTQQQKSYRNQYATLDAYLSTLNNSSATVTQLMTQLNKENN